jgi:hypothetical protein
MYILKIGVRDAEDKWRYMTSFHTTYDAAVDRAAEILRQNKTAGYDKISISIKEAVMHSE